MREYRADLHLHTLLSACAEVEMIPPLIVEEALYKGLDLIAVTDHNTAGNAGAVIEAAQGTDLIVLPGMELQSQEEVDLVCLFDTLAQAEAWAAQVAAALLPLKNDPEHFGPQYRVNAAGELVAEDERFYQGAAQIPLDMAVRGVHALGGLAIPAHIDRSVKGLMHMLGLWPAGLEADAAEVSPNIRPSQARRVYPSLPATLPLITASDAHFLDGIGQVLTVFALDAPPSIAELRLALQGVGGRRMYVP